jgi:aryl-alcohol dehydrogenase-like predicted oxidoreductase
MQPQEIVLATFDTLVKAGKVRHIAASNYAAPRLASALDISREMGLARFELLQPQLNLMVRSDVTADLQRLCIDRSLGVLPYFALASGFLTGKYRSIEDAQGKGRGAEAKSYMNARGFAVLAAMDEVAAENGASLSQIALAWIAAQPGVTAPIASATTVGQMEELLGAMRLKLAPEQLDRLDKASRAPLSDML